MLWGSGSVLWFPGATFTSYSQVLYTKSGETVSVLHIQCGQRVIRGRQRRDTHHKEKDQAKDQRAPSSFSLFCS